jgi:hypothetical protein
MKNLVEGQEISIFKDLIMNKWIKFFNKFTITPRIDFIIIYIFSIFFLCILVFFLIPKSSNLYDYLTFTIHSWVWFVILGFVLTIIFYIVRFIFFISLFLLSLIFQNLPNPSIIYFNDCLFVSTPDYSVSYSREEQIMFKGEIPFHVIERILFQKEHGQVTIILNKNSEFYKSEKFFSIDHINNSRFYQKRTLSYVSEDFTFQLSPELRGIGLQIVEELNSKLNKE